jgi:hypothetical protein
VKFATQRNHHENPHHQKQQQQQVDQGPQQGLKKKCGSNQRNAAKVKRGSKTGGGGSSEEGKGYKEEQRGQEEQVGQQEDEEQFTFTSIQVNKNYASALHVDRNNKGPSLIIGLGNYQGGQLWTYDQGPLDVKNKVRFTMRLKNKVRSAVLKNKGR